MNESLLTEREAARLWALAFNTHDATVLAPFLADNVRIMSQWVVNDMVGRDVYLDYLMKKFATFEAERTVVRVGIGETPGDRAGSTGRPCALLEQDGVLLATVLFDVVGGRLAGVTLGTRPLPVDCMALEEYPGFDEWSEPVN